MASAVSALTGTQASGSAASSSSSTSSLSAPSEEMFLQLLVAQLKNQDPLNPTDSTQFVSQLAQFSELEQVIAIRSDIEGSAAKSDGSAVSGADSTNGSTTNSTTPS